MPSIEPKTTILGYDNAYHLLRRSSYKITKQAIEEFALKTPQQALVQLFDFNFNDLNPRTPLNDYGETIIATVANPTITDTHNTSRNQYKSHPWFYESAIKNVNLQFRLTFLLHTFFISENNEGNYWVYFDYLELLRFHTKGSLKELAIRITRDVKMLYYLDNRLNKKSNPNENYAREFLELFTILKGEQTGVGNYTNYTEADVSTAARVLTGFYAFKWYSDSTGRLVSVDPITEIPRGTINVNNHDTDDKTFSAAFNNYTVVGRDTEETIHEELEDFVGMVFNQIATAKSYVRRIYRYFVGREITTDIENDIIVPLANTLHDNDYNIEVVVTQLLVSKHFYDEDDAIISDNIIGSLVKSPLELLSHLVTTLEVQFPNIADEPKIANYFYTFFFRNRVLKMNLDIFRPLSVNGYPPYSEAPNYDKYWVTSSTIRARYDEIINYFINGRTHDGYTLKFESAIFVKDSGHFSDPSNAEILVNDFFKLLLVATPKNERYDYFKNALLGNLSAINWKFEWLDYINTGNESGVKIGIDNLVIAIVKSPEYQVM